MRGRHSEEGAALINVLVLVGVLSALATTMFDRMRLARHLDMARTAAGQAQAGAMAAEPLLLARARGPLPPSPFALATPAGSASVALAPGGNCFNLNSVAMGPPGRTVTRALGVDQLARLLGLLEVPADDARRIAAATADWIDIDNQPGPGGAEDPAYARAATPYRTAGTLLADVSEWRAVAGVTPAIYARARPQLCALPETELSRPNINSLTPAEAPLLAALVGLDVVTARAAISARPTGGWASVTDFWGQPLLAGRSVAADVLRQPETQDRFITFRIAVGGSTLPFVETGLIAAGAGERPARLLLRRWGEAE